MKFNATEIIEKAEKDYGLGKGQYFKPKEGDNKIRLLSPFVGHASTFTNKAGITKQTFKFVAWIIDRSDGNVKLYFMPKAIADAIGTLQKNPEYTFEEVPMPYDLIVNAQRAGTIDVTYQVTPARNNVPLTPDEQKAFSEKPSIDEVIEKLKEQENASPGADSGVTEGSDGPTADQTQHMKNLMKMKGYTERDLFDLGIPLEKMTSSTYEEYIHALKAAPFKKTTGAEDINVEDIPF